MRKLPDGERYATAERHAKAAIVPPTVTSILGGGGGVVHKRPESGIGHHRPGLCVLCRRRM